MELTLREKYEDWRQKNPEIMRLFRTFALEAAEKNRKFGMKLIAERVRWEVAVAWRNSEGQEAYKINNNHVAYIARDLIAEMPQLASHICTRKVDDGDL